LSITPPPEPNPYGVPELPSAPPYGPPPGSPTPRKGLGAWAVVGIVFAALLALGVGSLGAVGLFFVATSTGVPAEGDCLRITNDSRETGDFEKLPCQDSRAVYVVEQEKNGSASCAGVDYTRFRIYDANSDRLTLCLALNVSNGECLGALEDQTKIAKVGCTSTQAQARVVVHAGVADQNTCDSADAVALVYQGPPVRTVCLLDVGESI
jgi:hypothetical protein